MKMRSLLFGLFLLAASLGAPSAVYAASISVSVSLSSVAQGSALPISWTSQSAPSGATVSLSLIPLPDREWATIGANKPLTGSMSWTVPSTYCHLDVCGLPLTPGQYLVRAWIVSGGQAVATGDSSDFSVTARVATTTAAPTCALSLSSRSVVYGNYLTLSWTSQRATAGGITGVGAVGPTGSARVHPGTSGTYTGVFSGPGGTGRCSVSVTVTAATNGSTIGTPGILYSEMSQQDQLRFSEGITYATVTTPDGPTYIDSTLGYQNYPTYNNATFRGVPEVYQNMGTDQTQGQNQTQTPAQTTGTTPKVNGLVGCSGAADCNLCAFTNLFQTVINFLIGLTVPLSALLFAWAGILYFSSGANPSQTDKAKKIFFSVAIGLIIAMGGWLGIQTLLKTVLAPGYYKDWNTIDCRQAPGSRPMSGLVKDWLSFLPQLNQNALVTTGGGPTCSSGFTYSASAGSCSSNTEPGFALPNGYNCPTGSTFSSSNGNCVNDLTPDITTTPQSDNGSVTGASQTITTSAGTFSCTNCAPIPSDIPGYNRAQSCSQQSGGACQADASLIQSLQGLNSGLSTTDYNQWYVSEAWPPTTYHASGDQNAGASVDISACNDNNNVNGASTVSQCVQTFQSVASQNNLRAVYEVPTASQQQAILQANPSLGAGSVIVVPYITGSHFSVYKNRL